MKREWSEETCQAYYNSIIFEQDYRSPHRYITDEERALQSGDVVADIGAAEGFFGLDYVERIRKLYLFEMDDSWIIPLKKTFAPWIEKVEVVKKYISDKDDDENATLDKYFSDKYITYIKADIEGAEELMLKGGENTFRDKVLKALICVYHLPDQEKNIRRKMETWGYTIAVNKGYILYIWDLKNFKYPYLRHGVLFGEKCQH